MEFSEFLDYFREYWFLAESCLRGESPKSQGGRGRSNCQLLDKHLDPATADPELVETIMRRLGHRALYGQTTRIQLTACQTILALAEKRFQLTPRKLRVTPIWGRAVTLRKMGVLARCAWILWAKSAGCCHCCSQA